MRKTLTGQAVACRRIDDDLDDLPPRNAFWQGAAWPIPEPALTALVDLGLSDERIALYFHVWPGAVQALRLRYGAQSSRR